MSTLLLALRSLGGWLLTNALDPRFWAVAAIVFAAGFLRGCQEERERHQEFRDTVERLGEAAAAWSKQRIEEQRRNHQEVVDELTKRLARAQHDNSNLLHSLQQHARRSVLPPAAPPAGRGPVSSDICFDRGALDEGLRGYFGRRAERLAADALARARTAEVLRACLDHDDRVRALRPQP